MNWRTIAKLMCLLGLLHWMGACSSEEGPKNPLPRYQMEVTVEEPPAPVSECVCIREELAMIELKDLTVDKLAQMGPQDLQLIYRTLTQYRGELDRVTGIAQALLLQKLSNGGIVYGRLTFYDEPPGDDCATADDEGPPPGYVETLPSPPILMPDGTAIGGDIFDPGAEAIPSNPTSESPPFGVGFR